MNKLLEEMKIISCVDPSSDAYASDPAGQCINAGKYDRIVFLLIQKTAGSNTGDAVITVEECTAADGTGATAIAFKYLKNETAASSDDFGAWQTATASGFSTTANKTAIYAIEISGADLSDLSNYVRVQITEDTDDPVIGTLIALAGNGPKGDPNTLPTAIT